MINILTFIDLKVNIVPRGTKKLAGNIIFTYKLFKIRSIPYKAGCGVLKIPLKETKIAINQIITPVVHIIIGINTGEIVTNHEPP